MGAYKPDHEASADVGRQQILIVTQLLRAVPTMHSIDELFQWLAYAIVQHFNLQIAQFWTPFINPTGTLSTHLRMMVTSDPSLPEQVVLNDQVVQVARRITYGQRSLSAQAVEALFPSHQAALLKRYSLNYCLGSYTNSNVLLPPPGNTTNASREPALFALTALLFLLQPPHRDLMPTINTILKQAIGLATNRGLLLPIVTRPEPVSQTEIPLNQFINQSMNQPASQPVNRQNIPPLAELIPRRREDSDLMMSSNPFARSAAISDKQARRLHAAIDGRKTVEELGRSLGMDMKETSLALRMLLSLHRIELYDAGGQLVHTSLVFKEL